LLTSCHFLGGCGKSPAQVRSFTKSRNCREPGQPGLPARFRRGPDAEGDADDQLRQLEASAIEAILCSVMGPGLVFHGTHCCLRSNNKCIESLADFGNRRFELNQLVERGRTGTWPN